MIAERGTSVTFDLLTESISGTTEDASAVTVSIINSSGGTVVNLAAPTTHPALGHYQYVYPVPGNAELGVWTVRWFATIDAQTSSIEGTFTVESSATIAPSSGQTCTPWATHEDAIGPCATYDVDPDELDLCMQIATDILWNLTGRQWPGICTDTIRPQAQWKKWDGPPMWWASALAQGVADSPWGWCSCHRGRETGCARVPELKLPSGPVDPSSVVVMLDGEEFSEWRVDDGRYLVRTDGDQWPCCQDLLLPDTALNTFSVTWNFAHNPPSAGRRMAAVYGCQIAMAFDPTLNGQCKLPARVKAVTRQGVSVGAVDPETLVEKGQVGIPTVDAWVASIIAGRARRRATVIVPGHSRSSRRVNH